MGHHLLQRARILLLLAAVTPLVAQEAALEERKPARILPAEMAHILLSEGREELEQPEKTLDAMKLKDGDVVADIGCGNGFYSLRVAKRVRPHGHVLAVDIQQGMLDKLEERMDESDSKNIYPILGAPDDPYLPKSPIDWVLMVDVYHEFSDPKPMLARIRECLAPGGKVALLEYRAEQDPSTMPPIIPPDHKMSIAQVLREWLPAGFKLVEFHDFLPAQHFFVFEAAD